TTIDIHERKLAEERFQVLTELAPAIIWFGNPDAASTTSTTIDIHERKLAEERFQVLTELAPAIIWFGNPDA
ncbi:hypothetical protein CTI14_71480, partial [Methylobacterium radiotolerans]